MEFPLTTSGIVFITLGWGFVVGLFITCNLKVLRSGSKLESSISESTAE
jgi:hypothetical protein